MSSATRDLIKNPFPLVTTVPVLNHKSLLKKSAFLKHVCEAQVFNSVVKYMPNMYKALGSLFSTETKQKKEKEECIP